MVFIPFRLYQGLWVYTSLWDLQRIVAGVGLSSALFVAVVRWGLDDAVYPRSVFLTDAMWLIVLMRAVRLARRFYHETKVTIPGRRVLVVGAGDAAEFIVRDMSRSDRYEAIGFVDDDPAKVGQRIHGLPGLGTRADLPGIMANYRPHEVLIAGRTG